MKNIWLYITFSTVCHLNTYISWKLFALCIKNYCVALFGCDEFSQCGYTIIYLIIPL